MRQPTTRHLDGELLWGDDFTDDELRWWYEREAASYAENYGSGLRQSVTTALDRQHFVPAFAEYLSNRASRSVLSLGGANGAELLDLASHIDRLEIVDPGAGWVVPSELRAATRISEPDYRGHLKFPDRHFDAATALSVLHHIANVTHVIGEVARTLKPGGLLAVREPVVSMGDWSRRRGNLTPNERGIPSSLLLESLHDAGFDILSSAPRGTGLVRKLGRRRGPMFASPGLVAIDAALSRVLAGFTRYEMRSTWRKLGPSSVTILAQRRA